LIKKLLTASAALSLALVTTLPSCGSKTNASGKASVEIENLGSDTLLEVAGALAEKYHGLHDHVSISVSGGGSGVGISNLIAGELDIANSSRPLKESEIQQAEKLGNHPVQHIVGYDGIAIFAHKDNPIKSLTVAQLKAMFGEGGKIESWQDLGINLGEDNTIFLGSRQNNSGTYECFRNEVLGGSKGRFKQRCNNLNGSKDVVEFCAKTKGAIGYSGLAYATDDVKVVPVIKEDGQPAVMPSIESVLDKSYAISRPLFMYTNGEPKGEVKSYLDWIKGDDGQKVLFEKGYVPLRAPKK
jgi:phosphate transport system substrate-binding protein